ncbi:MAG: hypothetical protein PVJ55_02130, partial [Anaerolineae bacterium]
SNGHRAAWTEFFVGGLATLLPVLIISGWWYLRNLRLYGDITGLNAFIQILGKRAVPATLAQLWRERYSFLAGYWGNFGGLNVPMPPWVYRILNTSLMVVGLGLMIALVRSQVRAFTGRKALSGRLQSADDQLSFRSDLSDSSGGSVASFRNLQFVVCVLWGVGVLVPWIQWARVTWSSQGRLIYAALPVWSLLIAMGLNAWWPRRLGVEPRLTLPPLVTLFALFLFGLSAAAPFVWIRPAYAHPQPLSQEQVREIPQRIKVDFDDAMRLLGYDLETETTTPGGQVAVTLYWEAIEPTEDDHTVFAHVLDDHELVIAQRDTHPGLGLLSTTWLDPGRRWADRYVIPVPSTAYAPDQAQVEVGLYNTRTGERLPVVEPGGEAQVDNVRFGRVRIQERDGDVPNRISVNFGDRMMLSGYDLSRRWVRPGETVTLTLHWEALQPMEENYTVSAQLIDEDSQRKAAQHDSWPLEGNAPTAAWEPGEAISYSIPLDVFPDATAGPYSVRIAVYAHRKGSIDHLPVTPPDGRMQASHVTLSQVKVAP